MSTIKTPKNIDSDVIMSKDEIRAFYDRLEELEDPYFNLLPFPDFLVKENPVKYGGLREGEFKNIENGLECLKLKEEGKEEEAVKLRKSFFKSQSKLFSAATNQRFQFSKPSLLKINDNKEEL